MCLKIKTVFSLLHSKLFCNYIISINLTNCHVRNTCKDFSLGKTRLQIRHFIPLGELDPSKMRWVITSALGRPRFPESLIICWCREPKPSMSEDDEEFNASDVILSGVAKILDVDVAANAWVPFISGFVNDDHWIIGLSTLCLSEEWGVLKGLSDSPIVLLRWNGKGDEKLRAFEAWLALLIFSGVLWERWWGVERGGVA